MIDELVAAPVEHYLDDLVPPRPAELQAMEAYARETSFPIVGPVAGHLCYQITRMTGARKVFEMGSGYGYSTAWFARAVQENGGGIVHHVVWDEALSLRAREHSDRLGLTDVVQYHVSEAVQTLRETPGPFDLIFNDINKESYPDALSVITERLRLGGTLIVDNALWGGRVFDPDDQSSSTEGVRELTRHITNDPAWVASLIPIRDGLLVAQKQ